VEGNEEELIEWLEEEILKAELPKRGAMGRAP
jgi:hypothetical protein